MLLHTLLQELAEQSSNTEETVQSEPKCEMALTMRGIISRISRLCASPTLWRDACLVLEVLSAEESSKQVLLVACLPNSSTAA